MSEREELKPCPLCGKKVSIARADDERDREEWEPLLAKYADEIRKMKAK